MSTLKTTTFAFVACPECQTELKMTFASCSVIVCNACRLQVDRNGKRCGVKVGRPSEDLARIAIHQRGRFKQQDFVITGRIRLLFGENGYINLWHAEWNGAGNNWIAESHHTYAFLSPVGSNYPLSQLLHMKLGQQFTSDAMHYYLQSSESKTDEQGEGELPEPIRDDKFLYAIATTSNNETLHYQILNKKEYISHSGRNIEYSELFSLKLHESITPLT